MKLYYLGILFLLTSCATKYLIPGNRFITPETQGQALKGQVEFQQPGATLVTINTQNATIDEGVLYENVTRSGFLISNSFFDRFDVLWSHTGGGNSMLGGKFQFIGDSRAARGAGHKASGAILFGGNEHETEDKSIEFELTGREYLVLYGYRINETVLPYISASLATYTFSGKIRSNTTLNGLEPYFVTESRAVNAGFEFSFDAFFTKVEATYQQLKTTDTKARETYLFGYSLGFSW